MPDTQFARPIIGFPNRAALTTSYTAQQIAKRYGFPVLTSPSPVRVALLELGGGYRAADFATYCQQSGIPVPPLNGIAVGATNSPTGDPSGPDGEVCLDIDVVAGATGGMIGIDVFFGPNTDAGFAQIVNAVAASGNYAALGISWGAAETDWSVASRAAMESAFAAWDAAKTVVFCASGDGGAKDGTQRNVTDYPASSPRVAGCGGTTIPNTSLTQESAWSYGGGGISQFYPKPAFQAVTGLTSRGVPDLAGSADPNAGYATFCDGQPAIVGGTSAVAPLYAALVALLVAKGGKRMGTIEFLTMCYQLHAKWTDITSGNNGGYNSGVGYDLCTGLGVVNAGLVAAMLAQMGTVIPPPPPPPPPPPVGTATIILGSDTKAGKYSLTPAA